MERGGGEKRHAPGLRRNGNRNVGRIPDICLLANGEGLRKNQTPTPGENPEDRAKRLVQEINDLARIKRSIKP